MAKIGDLQITKVKLTSGALSTIYQEIGGTSIEIIVTHKSNNPTVFFIQGQGSIAQLVRNRDSKLIGTVAGMNFPDAPHLIAGFVFDGDPIDGDAYTCTGLAGSGNIVTALVRLK